MWLIVAVLTVLFLARIEIEWKEKGSTTQDAHNNFRLAVLPSWWVVFTNAIMVSMWWVACSRFHTDRVLCVLNIV